MNTMGTVQTNADRSIIGITHRTSPGRWYHYRPECYPALRGAVDILSNARYRTNFRAPDVQAFLRDRHFALVTRQQLRAEPRTCETCQEVIE